jgi:hypothetical protein
MLRKALGVIAGVVVCMGLANVLFFALAGLWHDYGLHGREYIRHGVFTFTPLMSACNLVIWMTGEFAAGWVAMKISKQQEAVWVLAAIVVAYAAFIHLITRWSDFPSWYNLGVVIPAGFAVLLGARLAGSNRTVNSVGSVSSRSGFEP